MQTEPLSNVPVGGSTLALKNSNNVPLAGVLQKRTITATFAKTLDGLPMQLIYKGKTPHSFPNITLPDGFSFSANENNLAIPVSLLHTSKKS